MDINESLKARIMQSSVNGEQFVPIPMNEVNEILSTIESLEAERDKYREFLITFRKLTPYGMYHEMIDKVLGTTNE